MFIVANRVTGIYRNYRQKRQTDFIAAAFGTLINVLPVVLEAFLGK